MTTSATSRDDAAHEHGRELVLLAPFLTPSTPPRGKTNEGTENSSLGERE